MKQTRAGTPRIILLPEGPRLGRRLRDPDFDRRMTGAIWIGLYLAAVLSPLAVLLLGERPAPRSFWTELSVALGFVGLSVLCLQFALTARFRRVAAPYGVDMILQFHRQISFTAAAFVVAHPVLLIASDHPASLSTLNVLSAPWGIRFGMVALVALALLIGTSVARQPLKLSYEAWRVSHAVLAVLVVATALAHLLTVGQYLDLPWKRNLWDGFIVAMVGLLLYTRFGRPLRLWRRPYEVERVTPERGGCTTIVLRPAGHAGMRFSPGQFAWLRLGRSPFSIEEHPFSFTSSAEAPGAIAFTIKALGDFTATVEDVRPGTRAYVDGPFGAFTIDRLPDAPGFVFLAGGIGITPFMGMLRTMADRHDPRPVLLIYANKTWEAVTFRDELDALRGRLDLRVVHVLDQPPDDWTGERGFVSPDLLARHLPADRRARHHLLCGPPPMMAAVERSLLDVGVPVAHIHMERFNLV